MDRKKTKEALIEIGLDPKIAEVIIKKEEKRRKENTQEEEIRVVMRKFGEVEEEEK